MERIIKIIRLIIFLIAPVSVYHVLLPNAAALPDIDLNYQRKVTTQDRSYLRKNYNSLIGYLPRDNLVMTVIM